MPTPPPALHQALHALDQDDGREPLPCASPRGLRYQEAGDRESTEPGRDLESLEYGRLEEGAEGSSDSHVPDWTRLSWAQRAGGGKGEAGRSGRLPSGGGVSRVDGARSDDATPKLDGVASSQLTLSKERKLTPTHADPPRQPEARTDGNLRLGRVPQPPRTRLRPPLPKERLRDLQHRSRLQPRQPLPRSPSLELGQERLGHDVHVGVVQEGRRAQDPHWKWTGRASEAGTGRECGSYGLGGGDLVYEQTWCVFRCSSTSRS